MLLLTACGVLISTPTPVPPTATPVPPTATPVPPTATPIPTPTLVIPSVDSQKECQGATNAILVSPYAIARMLPLPGEYVRVEEGPRNEVLGVSVER
jgi:hypothetical protein